MITNFIAVTIHVCHYLLGRSMCDNDKSIHPHVRMNVRRVWAPRGGFMTNNYSIVCIQEGKM